MGRLALAAALVAGGCRDGASTGGEQKIAQPIVTGVHVAPESKRVDLASPTFSDPTDVSNPLFPVSKQKSGSCSGKSTACRSEPR